MGITGRVRGVGRGRGGGRGRLGGWVGCRVLVEGGRRGETVVETGFEAFAFLKTSFVMMARSNVDDGG